ncbi:MAG: adenylate/guanylate cyclase domain-containing protein [Rhodospirillales bacterium]|nr:adenylate/guanylate cyclase domain-containing protein [Rhodospirillales bacterium]
MEQAKALEQSADIVSAKVMKETYDPNTDTTQEVSIYRSKNLEVNGEVDAFEARRERLKGAKKSKKKRRSRRWGVKWLSPMALLVALYRALTVPTNSKQTKRVSGFSIKKAALKRSKVKQNKSTVRKNTINRNIDARRWESQKNIFSEFLDDIKNTIISINDSGDNYSRFGLCFFICGACDALIKKNALSQNDAIGFVADCLAVLRLPQDRARQFAAQRERYLAESPRYKKMYRAGHDAMEAYLCGSGVSAGGLQSALQAWNVRASSDGGEQQQQQRRMVTLMATHVTHAASTHAAATSVGANESGGDGVAEVARVHHCIVQNVLGQCGGTQLKSGGDGVLAAFKDAGSAVKAAVAIQCFTHEHNTTSSATAAMKLKIGLNVGDVDAGSAGSAGSYEASVKLTGHVCEVANTGQILCTRLVRRHAESSQMEFLSRGQQRLKGYQEPVPLYEIVWTNEAAAGEGAAREHKASPEEAPKTGPIPVMTVS